MAALTLTNAYHNLLKNAGQGLDNAKITYVAVGTGSAAPSASDTKLVSESYRKKVSSYTNGAGVGELLVNGYLNANDAVGVVIGEIGYFAGNSATSAANSGILVGRALFSHTKLGTEGIQLQGDITF